MAAANYGLFWLLSHQLSIDTLGGYSLLMNIFLMVQLLPLLGLAIPLQRRASTHPQELPQEVSNALAFAAPVSLLLMCGIGLAGWGYAPALHLPFWLVGASVLPSAWVLVADRAGVSYGLRLPGIEVATGQGEGHRRHCLEALALWH